MADLSPGWGVYAPNFDNIIPKENVLFGRLAIPVAQFNAIAVNGKLFVRDTPAH